MSVRFHPVREDEDEDADADVSSPPNVEDNREHPVITKVSLMLNPVPGIEKHDSSSSLLESAKERSRKSSSLQQNPKLMEDPRTLLLLLHQRDLEIKGLKRAGQKEQFNHLSRILDELLRSKEKGPPKKSPVEIALQKEVDQLNNELKVAKYDHKKEMEDLENQLIKSRLHVLHLEKTLRNLSAKSDSTVVLGELASEVFELWSEKGSRITSDTSDLRLRRIPKHTSFVDAYHKFGNVVLSDEDKKEIITRLEAFAQKAQTSSTTDESSPESSRTGSQLPSEQSSMAIMSSQKSDLTSSVTETKTTESSLETEKPQQEKVQALDQWNLAQAGLTIGRLSDGEKMVPSIERKKSSSIKGGAVKIVNVHRRGKFVRILNSSLNKEMDLSGYRLQQWVGGHPVSIYRFPSGTILPAQHHITIWSAAASLAHQQPLDELSGPRFFKAGPGCLTVLYDHSGQMISQHANSHQFTTAAEAYSDNLDLSLDKFPLDSDDDGDDEDTYNESIMPSRDLLFFQQNQCKHAGSDTMLKRRYTRHFSIDSSATSKTPSGRSTATKAKFRELNKDGSTSFVFSSKAPSASVSDSSSSSSEGDYFAFRSWKPLLQEPETRLASSEDPLKMPDTDTGKTSRENAARTQPYSLEIAEHSSNSGHENLQQYTRALDLISLIM